MILQYSTFPVPLLQRIVVTVPGRYLDRQGSIVREDCQYIPSLAIIKTYLHEGKQCPGKSSLPFDFTFGRPQNPQSEEINRRS